MAYTPGSEPDDDDLAREMEAVLRESESPPPVRGRVAGGEGGGGGGGGGVSEYDALVGDAAGLGLPGQAPAVGGATSPQAATLRSEAGRPPAGSLGSRSGLSLESKEGGPTMRPGKMPSYNSAGSMKRVDMAAVTLAATRGKEEEEEEEEADEPEVGELPKNMSGLSGSAAKLMTSAKENAKTLHQRTYRLLILGKAADGVELLMRHLLIGLVFAGTMSVMTETVVWKSDMALETTKYYVVRVMEVIVISCGLLEYAGRLIVCSARKEFDHDHPVRSRLRFLWTLGSVMETITLFVPIVGLFTLDLETEYFAANPATVAGELMRVVRGLRLVKFGRYSQNLQALWKVAIAKGDELTSTALICLSITMLLSLIVYVSEHKANPVEFPSMVVAFWWGVITLTTVGYGDIAPITNTGRVFGAIGAVLGIGLFTLPAGIIASGFLDMRAAERRRTESILATARRVRRKCEMYYAFDMWAEEVRRIVGVEKAAMNLRRGVSRDSDEREIIERGPIKLPPGVAPAAIHLLRETEGDLSVAVHALVTALQNKGNSLKPRADADGSVGTARASRQASGVR
mmetsp:Transcript_19431/g.68799  ORF Transcript_19431/g.68799 Transcript_19431/m.68799 type:complete len:572 (-) Transcript_19431:132-1847(-)